MKRQGIEGCQDPLLYFSLCEIIKMQVLNARNWPLFKFHFERQSAWSDLNSGNWWRETEEKIKAICPKGILYTLLH
jgi:hypothetical protein